MAEVEYAPIGPWWTLDGPSLRLPLRSGRYVSLWMTGAGPVVALLPAPGRSADSWLPLVPALQEHVTVVAVDNTDALGADDVATVLAGTGAQLLVADDDAGEIATGVDLGLPIVLHGRNPSEGPHSGTDRRRAEPIARVRAGDVEGLVSAIRALLTSSR